MILAGASLHSSNLQEANLEQANLSESQLGNADLRRANLLGAKLFDVTDYTDSIFEPPKLEGAIMPDGTIYREEKEAFSDNN